VRFAKYHGLGNDFLVVEHEVSPADGVALCDRQFGVGGDGVLVVLPPVTPGAYARMHVINSDGSIAEMCGNGLRCFVRHLHVRGAPRELVIDTNAGPLTCVVEGESITARLGRVRVLRGEIPMTGDPQATCIDEQLPGQARRWTGVSPGNPHAVTFVESAAEAKRLARELGPAMERHPSFPLKANVEFAHVRSRRAIEAHVWERACGLTLACGTGASATAVAAVLTDRADAGVPIEIFLPGGRLEIVVEPDLSNVAMTGPALHVFDGTIELPLATRPTAS
jgi:diaminopimelate epimerase